jgi:hypothetical protein
LNCYLKHSTKWNWPKLMYTGGHVME